MDNESSATSRDFRVPAFLVGGQPRYIFQNALTCEPSVSVSLYEAYLSQKGGSSGSVKNILDRLVYLFTWASHQGVHIERLLLNGLAPQPAEVRAFAYWLSQLKSSSSNPDKASEPITLGTYNSALDAGASIFAWFITQFGAFEGGENFQTLERVKVADSVKELFRSQKKKNHKKPFADDMSEEDIAAVEKYLKPANRVDVDKAIATRDYLLWRLAIEFGLRQGEMLALRTCDCPHARQNYIKIIRIDERGANYTDPRGAYMLRVKTLSRELGFALKDSPVPRLIGNYITEHRCRMVNRNGKSMKQPILDHDFLIINNFRKDGRPLSRSGMQKLAQSIALNAGVKFHWHLARHAFFNRAYAGLMSQPDLKERLIDLAHWGGWEDEKSLRLYVNRARRERATTALTFWQDGGNVWDALK